MSYEQAKLHFERRQTFGSSLIARDFFSGIAAETISCVFFVPIDVIKERLQGAGSGWSGGQ